MNELMQKIAEKLSVSVDKIPEVYESLKWQYVFWEVSSYMNWVFFAIIIAILIIYIIVYKAAQNIQTEEELLVFKKTLNKLKRILFTCLLIAVLLKLSKFTFAPDIAFLKGVLN